MLLAFAACKKRENLEPKTLLLSKSLDTEAIKTAKDWFVKQNSSFKSRTANLRTTEIDSIPFVPVWQYSQTFQLQDSSRLVLLPVYRFRQVHYNPQIGFLRLLAVHLQNDYTSIDGKILEIAGKKSVLPHDGISIAVSFYNQNLDSTLAQVHPFNVEDRILATYQRQQALSDSRTESKICYWKISYGFCGVSLSNPCENEGKPFIHTLGNCSTGNTSDPNFNPHIWQASPVYDEQIPDGTMVGGGGGNTGVDVGGWYGPPLYIPPPHEPSALLKSITKQKSDGSYDFGNLSEDEIKKLDETIFTLNALSPLMSVVFEELASHKLAWGAFSEPNSGANAQYTSGNKTIKFNRARGDEEVFVPKHPYSLVEELLHALQHKFYGANFTSIPVSNIELEAKFIRDLMRIHFEKAGGEHHLANNLFDRVGMAIPDYNEKSRYRDYIKKLTEDVPPYTPHLPNMMPKLENLQIGNQTIGYWNIMEDFRDYWSIRNPSYADTPNTNQQPELLFWLANNCNCTYRTNQN